MYWDSGLIVGMCGDGGNDCGVLWIVYVGIVLSEVEVLVVFLFIFKEKLVRILNLFYVFCSYVLSFGICLFMY